MRIRNYYFSSLRAFYAPQNVLYVSLKAPGTVLACTFGKES